MQEHPKNLTGFRVMLGFTITQHNRDEQLMKSFMDYFGCGKIEHRGGRLDFSVKNLRDTCDIIMPFFQKYPLQTVKLLNFNDFVSIGNLMHNKEHLSKEGIKKIINIKNNMNSKRDYK